MNEFFDTREIPVDVADADNNKVYGILSYLSILFFVPLLAAKDSVFAKFHANQGMVAFLTGLILNAATGIVGGILGTLRLGWLAGIIGSLVNLVMLAFAVIGIINAAQGKAKELPLIGQFHIIDSENKQV